MAKFTNYKNSPPRNKDERTILINLEISKPLKRVDLRYIIWIVKQAYGPRVQQIHRLIYKKSYPEYIDRTYTITISNSQTSHCLVARELYML